MKRGEHNDRNTVKAAILSAVILGINTYENLKAIMGRWNSPLPGDIVDIIRKTQYPFTLEDIYSMVLDLANPMLTAQLCVYVGHMIDASGDKENMKKNIIANNPEFSPLVDPDESWKSTKSLVPDEVLKNIKKYAQCKNNEESAEEYLTPKDIHYHLMSKNYGMVALGMLKKNKTRYVANTRTKKSTLRIIDMLLVNENIKTGYRMLFNAYTRSAVTDTYDLIENVDLYNEEFREILADFFQEKDRLKDFIIECYSDYTGNSLYYFLMKCKSWIHGEKDQTPSVIPEDD